MADPVLTDHFRVLATFERPSGLPEDRVVNSWAFRNDGAGSVEDMANRVRDALDHFYVGDGTAGAPGLRAMLAETLQTLTYHVYDLGQAPPREPTTVESGTWTAPTGNSLPGEVACCLSFYADRNLPRSRGRLFIGPLAETTVEMFNDRPRPSSQLRSALVTNATNLLNTSESITWVLVSQADGDSKVITDGWVDDAFDTQRRRGTAATTREVFPPAT